MSKKIAKSLLKKWREKKSKQYLTKLLGKKQIDYPHFLLLGIKYIKELQKINDFTLKQHDCEWICHVEGLEFILNSGEELFILNEIFINGTYNIEINKPFTFIDIGMNVGITSLFFAKQKLCDKVIAFEPFKPTLKMAKKNFAINEISSKIELHEIGLGYPARTLEVNYSEENKGGVGINGVPPYINAKNIHTETLAIADVFEALKNIDAENIILKIDCEGGEYEILERLNTTGLLSKFNVIMLEWHIKGPASLQKILLDNNFETLSIGEHNLNIGMLYAFKR